MERIETLQEAADCMESVRVLQQTGLISATMALGTLQLLGQRIRDLVVAPADEETKREAIEMLDVIMSFASTRARLDMSEAHTLSLEILQSLTSATSAMLGSPEWQPSSNPRGAAQMLIKMMEASANNLAAGLAPRLISTDAADALAADTRRNGAQ